MIKIRIDVDYPYPSRPKSFLFTVLNRKTTKNYLKNSKIIAKMINESPQEVMTYWFFTPQTTPDQEMLKLMNPDRHEVALHVANTPYPELERLEKATKRKVKYYTVHGTARILARLMWRRKIWEDRIPIPANFPLKNFWDFPTLGLDRLCYTNSTEQAVKITEGSITKGEVIHIHPEWLFQRGKLNQRGPYYETLRKILQVDTQFEGLAVRKKSFAKIASYRGLGKFSTLEYEKDFAPTDEFIEKLAERGADIFNFIERKWSANNSNPPKNWARVEDPVALLQITTYSNWWDCVGKKTRNMVRKAEKSGITTATAEPSEKLAEGIWKIYNETPIRQGRAFSYFGIPYEIVKAGVLSARESTFIGAFFHNKLVGFIQLVNGDDLAIISQILSLQEFWDKAVNNALIAKAIEVCCEKKVPRVMYGRMGNHPSLDSFKQNNSFVKSRDFSRCYVPLTRKGSVTMSLGVHRELRDVLPQQVKELLFPVFNWVSRAKLKIRLMFHSRK